MTDLIEKVVWDIKCESYVHMPDGILCDVEDAAKAAIQTILREMMQPTFKALEDVGMMEGYETDYPGKTDQHHIDWWQAMLRTFANQHSIDIGEAE